MTRIQQDALRRLVDSEENYLRAYHWEPAEKSARWVHRRRGTYAYTTHDAVIETLAHSLELAYK